jgi:hypothetical protein
MTYTDKRNNDKIGDIGMLPASLKKLRGQVKP